jgi:hypothetical protein
VVEVELARISVRLDDRFEYTRPRRAFPNLAQFGPCHCSVHNRYFQIQERAYLTLCKFVKAHFLRRSQIELIVSLRKSHIWPHTC